MCWSVEVTAAMVGLGAIGTVVTARRNEPMIIPLTLGYFTLMEGLQLAGYMVIDQCSAPSNQTVTFLSILHIILQPFVINAFAMQLVPERVRVRVRAGVYGICALSMVVMLMQLYPFDWAGTCKPGSILCGTSLCTVSGDWHLAWDVPYNGLLAPVDAALGMRWGFPTYLFAVFVVPFFYGAWRFAVFHAVLGPFMAAALTSNPNEIPAIWCLFSIGILLIALFPAVRRQFERREPVA